MTLPTQLILESQSDNLLEPYLHQLHLQGGSLTPHPDIAIRNFNAALFTFSQTQPKLLSLLLASALKQPHMNPTHFVDLLARCFQFLLRQSGNSQYPNYSTRDWTNYFSNLDIAALNLLTHLLETRAVATHVPTNRYRSLAALAQLTSRKFNKSLNIADLGCSLNLGLPCLVHPTLLYNPLSSPPQIEDTTPNHFLIQLLLTPVPLNHTIGVDIQNLSTPEGFDWVCACSYFSQYDHTRTKLSSLKQKLQSILPLPPTFVADVTHPAFPALLTREYSLSFDILHSSMMTYQLPPESYKKFLSHVYSALHENGVYIELTFIKPKNWFKPFNIATYIRFKNHRFSRPLEWLIWNNSRCELVKPGSDFTQVSDILESQIS